MNSCFRSMRFFSLFALFQYVSSSSAWDYTDEKTGLNAEFSANENYLKLTYGECILLFKSLSSEEIKKLENVSKDYFLKKIQTIAPPLQKRRTSNAINLYNLFALATDGSKEDPWERSVCISREEDLSTSSVHTITGGVHEKRNDRLSCVNGDGKVSVVYIVDSKKSDDEFDPFESKKCDTIDEKDLAYNEMSLCPPSGATKRQTKCSVRCLRMRAAKKFCQSAMIRKTRLFDAITSPKTQVVGQI